MKIKLYAVCLSMLMLCFLGGCSQEVSEEVSEEVSDAQEIDELAQIYDKINNMQYASALESLETIEIEKTEQEYYRMLGICYIGLARYEEAVEVLEYALSINPGYVTEVDFDTNYYLAVAYTKTGYYESAKAVYEAITALDAKQVEAYYLNGVTLLYMGRVDESLLQFDIAADLEPQNYDRLVEIYQVLDLFGYTSYGEAYLLEAVDNKVQDDDLNRGKMLYYLKDYQNAVLALEEVGDTKDIQESSEVGLYLGMAYEAMGDLNYAASVYESAIALNATAALYNQLGLCQLQRESYEAALEAFRLGLACDNSLYNQSLRYNEIVTLEYMSEYEEAKLLLEEYLQDYQSDDRAAREYEFLQTR
ncbi:MAG: tetratricopeptide repeat protein [Lachnospiraceae bacterium]